MLKSYQENVKLNLNSLEKYKNASVTEMRTQIILLDKMVSNKLSLTESQFFNPQVLRGDLSELKAVEFNLKSLGV